MDSNSVAKTALLSSFFTIFIIASLGYVFKESLVNWLQLSASVPLALQNSTAPLTRDEEITAMIERVNPAVVSVVVTKDVPIYEQYYEEYNPFGGFWGGGFQIPRVRESGTEEREVGGGSGFLVSADGHIITNRHVVSDLEARYSILTNEGKSYEVTVLARDPILDIAVLEIIDPAENLPYLTFGNSDELKLGQSVVAIGNALAEFRNSVSIGVISGLSRSITAGDGRGLVEQLDEVIQTDAAINPGNSGGPLLNLRGEVIGVNVAASLRADNIGFALPSKVVELIVESVKEYGEIVRPYLGVRYTTVTPQLKELNNLEVDYGALIIGGESASDPAIMPESPAEQAGLEEKDIILAIDGVNLQNTNLASILRSKRVGDTIQLKILRGDTEVNLSATLDRTNN